MLDVEDENHKENDAHSLHAFRGIKSCEQDLEHLILVLEYVIVPSAI